MRLRVGTYNTLDLEPGVGERWEHVVDVIRGLDVDVLALQELLAADTHAGPALATLAAEVHMECHHEPGRAAVAVGHQLSSRGVHHCTGLLWRPGIDVVPGSFLAIGASDFWHSLALLEIQVDGHTMAMASYHAPPFGRSARADQAARVASILTRRPGIVGADWNCISADPRPDNGVLYDHDWHANQPWDPHLIHQCQVTVDAAGSRRHWTDREPGQILHLGGLYDAAAALDAPWQPTTGHWPTDAFPDRRIDAVRVTTEIVPMLQAIVTVRTDLTMQASDHLPVVVTLDTQT